MNVRRYACTTVAFGAILTLLGSGQAVQAIPSDPPTTVASEQTTMRERYQEKEALAKSQQFDLILIGNSITANLDKPEYRMVWDQFYAPRKALNLGFSAARTQNLLWTIHSGILDGQHPKAVMLLIGTNNADDYNYHTHYTSEEIAAGIEADVQALREKLPEAKILMVRILPYGPNDSTRRATNDRAWELAEASKVDWQHVTAIDVNALFLAPDGSIPKTLMPDALHPTPEGAFLQAEAVEPALSAAMADTSRDPFPTLNNAVVPTPKLEPDVYDWWERHQQEVAATKSMKPEIVLIGDSITHFWGGPPVFSRQSGANAWHDTFGSRSVLNMGFGWDRTQNVLWRLDHGEFDTLHPKTVVVNIGTNNFTGSTHARENTPREVADGVLAIVERVRAKSPTSHVIVMGVLPRYEKPTDPGRAKIRVLNALLATALAGRPQVTFLDIGSQFLQPDGTLSRTIMSDYTHPTEAGYAIWGAALKPLLDAPVAATQGGKS